MNFEGMRLALRLLSTVEIERDDWAFSAEHDEIYLMGKPPGDLSSDDVEELETAGWFWDEETDSWKCLT